MPGPTQDGPAEKDLHAQGGRLANGSNRRYNWAMADDFETRMNFIIEQQAQFAVDIQKLQETQARTAVYIQNLQEAQARTDDTLRRFIDVNFSLVNHVQAIGERMVRLAEAQTHTDERIKELIEFQAHTDQRLDALIDVVNKLARRNGAAGPPSPWKT